MRERFSKKVNSFLRTESKGFHTLIAKVQELEGLNQRLALYLNPAISKYCQVANRVGNRIILIAANGSIATELRFQSSDLIRKFKQDPVLSKIQEIHCKVRPAQSTRFLNPTINKMACLTQESANAVKAIASSISDPALRDVLLRIASHTSNRRK